MGSEGLSERNYGRYLRLISDKLGRSTDRDNKIKPLAMGDGINLLYSVPNFEAFLLRHFPGCENKRPSADTALSELEKVWPEYHKGIDARSIHKQLGEDGLRRACAVEDSLRHFLFSIGFNRIFPELRN